MRVNAVCPGPIDTRMIHSLETQLDPADPASVGDRYQAAMPIGRYGTADEVANVVLFLCSDLAGNITGCAVRRRRRPHRDRRLGDRGAEARLRRGSAAPAIGRHALVGQPQALRRRAGLPEHVDRDAAARIPVAADAQPARLGTSTIRRPIATVQSSWKAPWLRNEAR